MDGDVKMLLSIYKFGPSTIALTQIGTEKYESICRYVPDIMTLTYVKTEKCHKISKAYHNVNEAKL